MILSSLSDDVGDYVEVNAEVKGECLAKDKQNNQILWWFVLEGHRFKLLLPHLFSLVDIFVSGAEKISNDPEIVNITESQKDKEVLDWIVGPFWE